MALMHWASGLMKTCLRAAVWTTARNGSICAPKSGLQSLLLSRVEGCLMNSFVLSKLLNPVPALIQPVRTRILFSLYGGKPQTDESVTSRFLRLYNGLWIRARAGRHKKRWMKRPSRVHRLKQHVVCNKTQCRLLDQMTNKCYKLPKYYIEDPYAPYHRKSNLPDYRYQSPKFYP